MSHEEGNLFDDFEEQPGADDLFGAEDEPNLVVQDDVADGGLPFEQPQLLDEEEEDEGQQQQEQQQQQELELEDEEEPPPAQASSASERRKLLMQLARKAQGADGEAGPRKKKHRGDKQHGGGDGGGGGRPQRLRRQRAGSPDGDYAPDERGGGAAGEAQQHELLEDEIVETAADRDFIDDDGVPEDQRYEDDDVAALAAAEEAEEAAPGEEEGGGEPTNIIDEVLQRRKRAKRRESDAEIDSEVMSLVSMMTACAEKDAAAMDSRPPQPAIEKLKALAVVDRTLRQRKYHETFLATKGLNAMAAWLKPYANGTLPNAKVRCKLVELLDLLGLDTTNDYVRERLEESELGKIVMFYYKNPNESMPLRSQCRDLIQAWSAPIFADNDEELRKRRQRERAHRQRQAAERTERERRERLEVEAAERRRKLAPHEEGFRARAAVPMPSKMDFVINPGSKLDSLEGSLQRGGGGAGGGGSGGAGGPKAKQSPIGGKLGKVLQQRKRGKRDRMGGMSVEGRGIQL